MNQIATDFLSRCFAPGETIAVLLRNERTATIQQRVLKLERVLAPGFGRWLAHENHHGANIYVAANPLLSGSRRRTKEFIASVRHLYLDIDVDGKTRIALLRSSDLVPTPTALVSTSAGKFQVLWRVEGFNFQMQEMTLKLLVSAFGGDNACTDCNRVLRIPGFLNCKYDPAQLVMVEYLSYATYLPEDFQLYAHHEVAMDSVVRPARACTDVVTHSERDWAWVSQELVQGKDAATLTRELASRRIDKSNPTYYAQRTIDMASARLSLLEGKSISDVIAMLEDRRQNDLPAATCSARAREIATTAQRMLARHSQV